MQKPQRQNSPTKYLTWKRESQAFKTQKNKYTSQRKS